MRITWQNMQVTNWQAPSMDDISPPPEPWHLGYFRFNAFEFGWLISGAPRTAYLSLSSGGILELSVRLSPEQARDFVLRKRIHYTTTVAPTRTWKTDAQPLMVAFDLLPPRKGKMRYTDRSNAYASAKTGARCKGLQGQAREGIESLRRELALGQQNEYAMLKIESIAEAFHMAWLEAWGYLPWMAGQNLRALEFAAEVFGPPAYARSRSVPLEELRCKWKALLNRWDSYSETTAEKLERLEALAKWVGASVRAAEEKEWPSLEFSDETDPKFTEWSEC